MTIFRGTGGGGDATTDSQITALAAYATQAQTQAELATTAAGSAVTSASNASTSASNAAASAATAANTVAIVEALAGVAPPQTGNAGKFLTTNATNTSWATVPYASVTGTPTLSTVAGTGAYADLTGKPTLGTLASLNSVAQANLATGVAGTGPAFRVYLNANQTVTTGVATKVTLNTEVFDTASAFDSTTNYRFTPQVAGYYQFNVTLGAAATVALTYNWVQIYKNGTSDSIAIYGPYSGTSSYGILASLVYLNGSTDYIELYANLAGTGTLTVNGGATSTSTYMSGYLARAA